MIILKSIIFYPMLFFRRLFMIIAKFFGIIFFLAFLLSFAVDWIHWEAKIITISVSFSFFLLRQFYDSILLKLNPTKSQLTLYQ